MPAACVCRYQRKRNGEWYKGLAIVKAPGMDSVIAIYPEACGAADDGLSDSDVWSYELLWYEGTIALPAQLQE